MINRVLPFFSQLESLDLSLGPANVTLCADGPRHAIERAIHHCRFPHLHSCSLNTDFVKGCRPYTTELTVFLSSLENLNHLRLGDCQSLPSPMAMGSLLLLKSFRGTPSVAASLLPDRPVQDLGLCGQDTGITAHALLQMQLTTIPLRSLDLSAVSLRPVTLRAVCTAFPHLERIRIRLALRHTLHYALSGIVRLFHPLLLLNPC